MFEVDGWYINRKGRYQVLALEPPRMRVRYEDGAEAELNIGIQERIWENILVEQEAQAAKRSARAANTSKTQFFVKAVAAPSDADFSFAGWQERVVLASEVETRLISPGDRLIYYSLDTQNFVAVATITGPATEGNPKDYFYTVDAEVAYFFPVDVDAAAPRLNDGVPDHTVELESQPSFRKLNLKPESYLKITEDDFELLAEILTEVVEEEEDEDLDDDDYLEDDEE